MSARGWLYLNPDTGTEYDEDHPVRGGMVPDAEDIRPANAKNLKEELIFAWEQLAEAKGSHAELGERFCRLSWERDAMASSLEKIANWMESSSGKLSHEQVREIAGIARAAIGKAPAPTTTDEGWQDFPPNTPVEGEVNHG
jgi:hypothetical protein